MDAGASEGAASGAAVVARLQRVASRLGEAPLEETLDLVAEVREQILELVPMAAYDACLGVLVPALLHVLQTRTSPTVRAGCVRGA